MPRWTKYLLALGVISLAGYLAAHGRPDFSK
jgi:hypothetical protein